MHFRAADGNSVGVALEKLSSPPSPPGPFSHHLSSSSGARLVCDHFVAQVLSRCLQHLPRACSASLVWLCRLFQDNNGVIGLVAPHTTSKVPVRLPLTEPVIKISSGKKAIFFFSPVAICSCSSFNVCVSAPQGNDHVALVTREGHLYTFGTGEQGQLGRVSEFFSNRGGRHGLGEPPLLIPVAAYRPVRS